MNAEAWLLAASLITATGGVFGTWLNLRRQGQQAKTTDAQQLIDQLQEMRGTDDDRHLREIAAVRADVAELRSRVARMESRELSLLDYVSQLRWHIDQQKPPPPPEWPTNFARPS